MKARKVLYRAGKRGDSIRVVVDTTERRVIVLYRGVDGNPRKMKCADTKAGRSEAVGFAEGWFKERERIALAQKESATPAPLTVGKLWDAFKASEFSDNAGEGVRAATRASYTSHFNRFLQYVGETRAAESIKAPELATMRAKEREAGRALNQCRLTQNVVRIVFRWGIENELLTRSPLALVRWKSRKDAPTPAAPGEYTTEEYERLLRAVDRDDSRQWRAWVFLMLVGHYGMRANSVLHLRWSDIDVGADMVTWAARYQKQGVALVRPLVWEAWSALLVAKRHRDYSARACRPEGGLRLRPHYKNRRTAAEQLADSDWVLFAERDKSKPMSYQSMWYHLTEAEKRAKVTHKDYQAAHGFRRMVVGNVIEATGDRMLGLEVVGDKDPKVLQSYDKRLADRVAKGMAAVTTTGASAPGEPANG